MTCERDPSDTSGASGALLLWSTSPSPAEARAIAIARSRFQHRETVEPLTLKIVVLQTPLDTPDEHEVSRIRDQFSGHGVEVNVSDPGLQTRDDAHEPSIVAAIRGADLILIAGGQPTRMMETIRDTPALTALRDAGAQGAIIGGGSAGAMIFGAGMLDGAPGFQRPAALLGWLAGVVIAPHYGNYPIEPWFQAYPTSTFLCLPDRSVVLITHNRTRITSVGEVPVLLVLVVDGSSRAAIPLCPGTSFDLSYPGWLAGPPSSYRS